MIKYINADTITKMVVDSIIGFQFTEEWTELAMKDFISKMLSEDVVEVVRCGDCKHIDLNSAEPIVCNGIASALCRCNLHERSVRVEDFCSYGEARTDDEQ